MVAVGNILLSEPFLGDNNFERSVVLLCSHNTEGSLGFIFNNKSSLILTDVVEDIADFDSDVYIGGPVEQDTLHFVYREKLPLKDSVKITENLFWGGDFEELKLILRTGFVKKENIRFFLGYSGWSDGQLEQEINEKVWITTIIHEKELFTISHTTMWRDILKNMGGQYKLLSNYPIDPRLN